VNVIVDVSRWDKKKGIYTDGNLICIFFIEIKILDFTFILEVTQFAMYGKGNGWSKEDAYTLIHKLILDDVLEEQFMAIFIYVVDCRTVGDLRHGFWESLGAKSDSGTGRRIYVTACK
jgi:hypothetical protein